MGTTNQIAADPNWVAAIVACIALVVSLLALWMTRRNRQSEIEQAFVQQRNDINRAFADYNVKGPFAHLLGIEEEQLDKYIPKACLLFLQINLLNDVYQHRKLLPPGSLAAYDAWAGKILCPWIHSDKHLIETLKLIYATDDLMPRDFMVWMKERVPATTIK